MNGPIPKVLRCAIYTRKSTEHNLDLAFTSLDAQREACEAYIRSQASEGWRLLPAHYDDGAYSGASLQRPALQALLTEVRARKVDVVVVYKVDRLTRSLADFAKLVELFDAHGVSFVSVTQSFNTTSSMGRLTLNILLSFAQFEREVIGERVRDKIAASKRKGIWVGGPVPLGYAAIDKKVTVIPAEAETVRTIFTRYLELGSIRALAEDLDHNNIRTKQRKLADGCMSGGGIFGTGGLAHLLRNRFYIGQVVYRGESFRGNHEPILDPVLFEAVQAKLSTQAVERRCRVRGVPALLAGRLFDDQGHRLTPTHTNKAGVRYRYYVFARMGLRIPAAELEQTVLDALRRHLQASGVEPGVIPADDRQLIEEHLLEVTASFKKLVLRLLDKVVGTHIAAPNAAAMETSDPGRHADDVAFGPETTIAVTWSPPAATPARGIIHIPAHNTPLKPGTRETLLILIAKARRWIDDLAQGRLESFAEIADQEGNAERHVRQLAALAFVSPRVVSAIIDGTAPASLTPTALVRALPLCWAEQERRFGARAIAALATI